MLPDECSSEWQRVMCAELAAAPGPALGACCAAHAPGAEPLTEQPAGRGGEYVPRGDLGPSSATGAAAGSEKIDWYYGNCTELKLALVPAFARDELNKTQVGQMELFWGVSAC